MCVCTYSSTSVNKIEHFLMPCIVLSVILTCVQDVADVASTQVRTLEVQHVSHEKENKSLRQQLLDFQVQSDEKTIIGECGLCLHFA